MLDSQNTFRIFQNTSLKYFLIFSISTMVHIFLERENVIFVKQYLGWFEVNETNRSESVGFF